jgi:hypothetical protein
MTKDVAIKVPAKRKMDDIDISSCSSGSSLEKDRKN